MPKTPKVSDTSKLFVGGAGMFIQYHDIIKPVYFYAIMKMAITGETYGVPVELLENFSLASMLEWYVKRRYVNPIQQLDVYHQSDPEILNTLLKKILKNDQSLYELAPQLPITKIFAVYKSQKFSFPIYIYSEEYEEGIEHDIDKILQGIEHEYLYGDLNECIGKCNNNFTYIFSNIEIVNSAAKILTGSYAHIILARDYRYNYIDNCKTFKYDLNKLMRQHPFIRTGTIEAMDITRMDGSFDNIFKQNDSEEDETEKDEETDDDDEEV